MEHQPLRVTHLNRSGTITAGGTAQNAAVARNWRGYLMIQNPKTETETLFVNLAGTATNTGNSIGLESGEGIIFENVVPIGAVSVLAATTGHKFVVIEA